MYLQIQKCKSSLDQAWFRQRHNTLLYNDANSPFLDSQNNWTQITRDNAVWFHPYQLKSSSLEPFSELFYNGQISSLELGAIFPLKRH